MQDETELTPVPQSILFMLVDGRPMEEIAGRSNIAMSTLKEKYIPKIMAHIQSQMPIGTSWEHMMAQAWMQQQTRQMSRVVIEEHNTALDSLIDSSIQFLPRRRTRAVAA